jgi:hypothetical protein
VIIIFREQFREKFYLLKRTQISSYSYQFAGKSIPTRTLQDDQNDFLAIVPVDQIHDIFVDYLLSDPEVLDFFFYIQSDEFYKIIGVVEGLPEYRNVSAFLCYVP